MRIALIQSAPRGGLLHYAVQLAGGLAGRGHSVVLITARDHELAGGRGLGAGAGVGADPTAVAGGRARIRAVLPAAARYRGEPPTGLRYLRRRAGVATRLAAAGALTVAEVRRGRFDAVVLVDDLNVALAALPTLLLASLPGGPALAAICHEPRPRNRWSTAGMYAESVALRAALARLYRRLDLVVVHGEASRAEVAARWAPPRVAMIRHGNAAMLAPRPLPAAGEERILFFGDWRRSKGLPELMQAFDLIRRRRPQARLTIAGTPYPDGRPDAVRAWARAHGEAVTVIDRYVSLEELPAVFGGARVVATPYLAGSQSGVLHLAMSFGRAVVTSDVGELGATVIDGDTGRVVPAGDVRALARALEQVAADPQAAARMGQAGRSWMLSHADWTAVAGDLERELEAVLR